MAIVIPYAAQTWTDGSGGGTPVSAARLGVIEEGIKDVSFAPAVRVNKTAVQTITTATHTAIQFDAERFDQAANAASTMHDNVTNNTRLTCRYAGIYSISGGLAIQGNAAGNIRQATIKLNGTTEIQIARSTNFGAQDVYMNVSGLYSLAVNDYVELMAYQDSGGSLNALSVGNTVPEFMMVRVG